MPHKILLYRDLENKGIKSLSGAHECEHCKSTVNADKAHFLTRSEDVKDILSSRVTCGPICAEILKKALDESEV